MYILFSPSEGKQTPAKSRCKRALEFLFHTTPYKQNALNAYLATLRSGDESLICRIFGTKTLELDTLALAQNLLHTPRLPAIELYNGVAYKALDFGNLPQDSQAFLLQSVLICSNLFGFVRASDELPFYKLHQGKGMKDFALQTLYTAQKHDMDTLLANHEVLDLRAEIYAKVYPLDMPHTQISFLKNGKKLSHASKLYRGLYLRQLALSASRAKKQKHIFCSETTQSKVASDITESKHSQDIDSDFVDTRSKNNGGLTPIVFAQVCLANLHKIHIEGLKLQDIIHNDHKQTLVYEIVD